MKILPPRQPAVGRWTCQDQDRPDLHRIFNTIQLVWKPRSARSLRLIRQQASPQQTGSGAKLRPQNIRLMPLQGLRPLLARFRKPVHVTPHVQLAKHRRSKHLPRLAHSAAQKIQRQIQRVHQPGNAMASDARRSRRPSGLVALHPVPSQRAHSRWPAPPPPSALVPSAESPSPKHTAPGSRIPRNRTAPRPHPSRCSARPLLPCPSSHARFGRSRPARCPRPSPTSGCSTSPPSAPGQHPVEPPPAPLRCRPSQSRPHAPGRSPPPCAARSRPSPADSVGSEESLRAAPAAPALQCQPRPAPAA